MAANDFGAAKQLTDICFQSRDDEEWQTSLKQITFDVMSVRKPLFSTPALKRQGVTIIFNHDYYRIFFWKETANLVRMVAIRICMSDVPTGLHLATRWS